MHLTSVRVGLDGGELATTALAVIVSGSLYLAYGAPYLARGVVGDAVGFAVLTLPLVLFGERGRHEALTCLAMIGVVHLLDWDWPLELPSWFWWVFFVGDLVFYLALRRGLLRTPAPRRRVD